MANEFKEDELISIAMYAHEDSRLISSNWGISLKIFRRLFQLVEN